MIQVPPTNNQYYINARALTFSENDLGDPNRVTVSLVSGTVIMVHIPGTIDWAADGSYEKWTLRGYSTKLVRNEAHYIYARLSRADKTALLVFSVNDYNLDGSITTVTGKDEQGNDITSTTSPNENYFFVKIGHLTETDGASDRELTYDSGLLSTPQGNAAAGYSDMWEIIKSGALELIRAKKWLSDFTLKGFITLIGGLIFKKDNIEKPVTDIRRSVDSSDPSDELYVPVDDTTVPTTAWVEGMADERYLKKFEPDETEHRVKFFDGLECGKFIPGMVGGSGTLFDGEGNGEMNGLVLREFLEVPELRFNRIDVVSGELWNSVAFGLVEDVDTENRICTLKLEPGERAGLRPLDICRGIFADFGGAESYEGPDECGFTHLYGFYTSYFSVAEILEDSDGVCRFTYSLRKEDTPHPCKSMKFAVYGSFDDRYPERQASAYSTKTYKRYLNKVNTWVIDPERNIYAQYGDLSGLVISGLEMSGYGSYQSNSYLKGVQIQLSDDQKDELRGEDAYSVVLSDYIGVVRMDSEGNIVGGEHVPDDGVSGDYVLRTRIQAFRGRTELLYSASPSEGRYTATVKGVGCSAEVSDGVVSVVNISDTNYCYVSIGVSCEGYASYTLTYQVKVIKDGVPSITADLDNEMDSISCSSDGKVLFGLPVSTNVSMWSGLRQLEIDRVEVSAPQGVSASGVLSGDSKKATVTVDSVEDGVGAVIPVNISVYAVVGGSRYRKDLVFTVNKILQGEGAVIYKLRPSVSAVKVDDAGVMTANLVRCYVTEHDGSGVRVLDALPQGVLVMEYSIDEGEWNTYSYASGISMSTEYESVSFRLRMGDSVVDIETIPIVRDGSNPVTIDLDNEMQSVACDKDGNVLSGLPLEANVSMWFGSTQIASSILGADPVSGVVTEVTASKIKVTDIGPEAPDNIRIGLLCNGVYKDVSYRRNVTLHINKVKSGENGEPAVILELNPSDSVVKVDKDGNVSPASLSCKVNRITGSEEPEILSSLPSGYSMRYSEDAGAFSSYTYGTSVDVRGLSSSVTFRLYKGSDVVDTETIPVLADGEDGKTPVVYRIVSDVMVVRVDNNGKYSAKTVYPTIIQTAGESVVELMSNPVGYSLKYSIDYSSLYNVDFAYGIDVSGMNEMLSLILMKGNMVVDKLMVPLVNDGSVGETTTIFSINPSANVITERQAGVYEPSSITASVMRRAGVEFDVIETLPSDYSMELWRNGVKVSGYSYGSSYSILANTKNIEFRLYSGTQIIDKEIIPVITGGSDGESVVIADLSNDMVAVECDENGAPVESYSDSHYLSTVFRAYYGLDSVALESLTSSSHTGMVVKCDYQTGLVKITSFTSSAAEVTEVVLTGNVRINGASKTLVKNFTVSKIMKGEPGGKGDPGEPGEDGTYIEEVFTASDTQPATPTATTVLPSGWTKEVPDIMGELVYTTSNTLWEEHGSFRKSEKISTGESTTDKITFNFTEPTWVVITLSASCYSLNYGYIGNLNALDSDVASSYLGRVSGKSSITKTVLVPSGSQAIRIKYVKSYSYSTNGDYIEYKISTPNIIWQSRAQATWNGSAWIYGTWTEPRRYSAANDMEELYMLRDTESAPEKPDLSPSFDNYLPVAPAYNSDIYYSIGEKVLYNGKTYECIKSGRGYVPSNTSYWKEVPAWTLVPSNVSEKYPFQYITKRKKSEGVWGEWSDPVVYSVWSSGTQGKNGLDGCVTRTWEKYESARVYRNDSKTEDTDLLENPSDGIRYIDVVVLENSSAASGYMAYQCLKNVSGENPGEQQYTNGVSSSGNWRMLDSSSGLYVTTLIARNANIKFGSTFQMAVYDSSNNVVGGLKGVEDASDIGIWYGSNKPEEAPFRVDKSGHMFASDADITGVIEATGGRIGGFEITGRTLSNSNADDSNLGASIEISNMGGTRFSRLNGMGTGSAAEFRNDHGVAVNVQAYGDSDNIGLKVLGNQDSKAVHATGSSFFITRKNNLEYTYISGLKVCTRSGNSLSASNDSADPYFPYGTNVDFLIVTGNVTLPDASSCRGRVIFTKRRDLGSIVVTNCYQSDGTYKASYTWSDNSSRIFISDGTYWNEFHCS